MPHLQADVVSVTVGFNEDGPDHMLSPGSSEAVVLKKLAPHSGARRLHVAKPLQLWGGFADGAVGEKLDARFFHALGALCCWKAPPGVDTKVAYAEFMQRSESDTLSIRPAPSPPPRPD